MNKHVSIHHAADTWMSAKAYSDATRAALTSNETLMNADYIVERHVDTPTNNAQHHKTTTHLGVYTGRALCAMLTNNVKYCVVRYAIINR